MTNEASAPEVDARGMKCPWPVLRLARAMRTQDTAILLADDPNAGHEIAALAAEHGWHVTDEAVGRWRVIRG